MAIQQISLLLENKPGKLTAPIKLLSDAGINIRAISIADTKDFGICRLIVSDTEKAKTVLSDGFLAKSTSVIAVEMKDEAGYLSGILEALGKAGVNIEYMYAFTAASELGAYVVLRVDDNAAAEKMLADNGYSILSEADMARI